jgi:hypothetical protein
VIYRLQPLAMSAILAVMTGGCSSSTPASNAYAPLFAPAGEPMCIAARGEACSVSLIALIANPAKYAGKKVQIIGFATLEFEGNAVYLSKEGAEIGDNASAIWLDLEGLSVSNPEKLNRQFVLIAGTFDAENRGHIGMFAGTIKSIFRLEQVKQ